MTSRQARSEYARVAGPAVAAVQSAVQSGRLVRQPCAVCGDPNVQGHHPNGYDRVHALDVEWVCRTHHLERHGRRARAPWERSGHVRAYMASTGRRYEVGSTYTYSDWSSPQRLFMTLKRVWGLFRTDEERDEARRIVEALTPKPEAVA